MQPSERSSSSITKFFQFGGALVPHGRHVRERLEMCSDDRKRVVIFIREQLPRSVIICFGNLKTSDESGDVVRNARLQVMQFLQSR